MLLEGGEIHGVVHEHGGVGSVVVAEGLVDDEGDVKDSSLVAGLSDHSAPGRRRRGRGDRVLSLQRPDLQEFLAAEGAGVLGLGPLPDAAQAEGVLAAID